MRPKVINGRNIADEILENLRQEIHKKHRVPRMVVVLIGNDPSSLSYIRQKQYAAERIGAICQIKQFPHDVSQEIITEEINNANADTTVHGIIVQRPIPKSCVSIPTLISPQKDIDGLLPESPHEAPSAAAVLTILQEIYKKAFSHQHADFFSWLRSNHIVVIGKGETAGKPLRLLLEKHSIPFTGIDQSTLNPQDLMKTADILVSCVGKKHIITASMIKHGVILISVGLTRDPDGTIHGDYDEHDIHDKASLYTPTPGGVGPVTVACLMQNLVKACILQPEGETL
ncbi:MAG: bifunctional 5,10-methylenetetrahydrofolate dehydrogenase/5,10-methenyltetrahydrofolate cyclohydrolase [Patescibacteria group bacterium]|nr:bifunctional 5,10-methylenetetrahydrofolate dehydrogenase/5,10-methenyltetrahydrofolate cyclohydrolase [Patescibacteria group bacterium]